MLLTRENWKKKWCVQSEATEVCQFAPKFPPFACSAASHTFNEKRFSRRVFLVKKVKNISEIPKMEKQQRKWKNKTRRKLICCSFYRSYFVFHLLKLKQFIFKQAILLKLKFIHFQLCIQKKQLTLLVVLGLPYILTLIYVFNKRFY